MNEDYSKWSQFIDEAVNIYNNTKMFQQERYLIMQFCFNRKKIQMMLRIVLKEKL